MTDTLVALKNVELSYRKGKKALHDISFSIKRGELVSLIGLNGTGKTSLLKIIVGLLSPTKGRITRNTDRIFYIPQKHDIDTSFPLTVQEFCELFGEKGYKSYLAETGMQKFLRHRMGELSGGEFQRVLIAIALSRTPDLLLLDEPTSGIDVAGEASFYALIDEMRTKHGIAILLVSHDIHLVMKNTDTVLCLSNHLCCKGTPVEVTANKEFQAMFGKHVTPYVHKHDHVH